MSIIGDLGKSITGNIEPAYILIKDYRAAAAAVPGFDMGAAAAALGEGFDASAAAPKVSELGGAFKKKLFRVQYNPAELEIYSVAPEVSESDLNSDGGALVSSPQGGKMELSVTLWFDKMSAATSFMLEKNITPTSVSGVTNAVKTFMKEESVQQEVEGFIAALRNPYTQNISFYWSYFSFSGAIISISAQYVMFSASGLPVRAKVALRVRQYAGESSDAWVKDFETAFGNDKSSLVTPEQMASNILNLG
ncbi:MAG: hypothetical protein LBK57_11010 [Clostridiales Family XIII bacterium]|jgi:hypothetical protein|nr:hypothetical protein [Clostridiales Family XIII bacterium]